MDPQKEKVGAALVVGGGIGGMQAALDLAESGIKVYLVDSKPSIGGVMSQLDKTFPTNECAMCTMAPRLVDIGRHKDIEILTLTELDEIEGEAGNFRITLKRKARYIDESKCTGCGECTEKCPIEIPSDHNLNFSNQKAIYRRYPQAIPNVFAIEKLGQSPCRYACPIGQKAQGYISLIREKRYEDAYKVIRRDNPFPSVCGRICNHRCEGECTRNRFDEPIAIMNLKRFVADWAYEHKIKLTTEKQRLNGRKVAIIGSGPAGLTAAQDLRNNGYHVTVFEALPVIGGMVRVGVPEYRLPRERLEWEIQNILMDGIEIKLRHRVESVDSLLQNGFDAVFIAIGSHVGKKLRIPGVDVPQVHLGTDFLRAVALDEKVALGKKVLVIGGGNVAIDVARTALRLGAENLQLSCLESRETMPAHASEVDEAEKEGIKIYPARSFVEVISSKGEVTGVKCVKVNFRGFVDMGRPEMDVIPNTEHIIECDMVLFAIGQVPQTGHSFLKEGIELSERGTINVDPDTLATSKPAVFAGGDAVTGTQFVVDAVAAGHRAALSVDRYLKGETLKQPEVVLSKVELNDEEIAKRIKSTAKRSSMLSLPENERRSLKEVNFGYNEEQALKEAERCLNCGICSECMMCVENCKAEAIDHHMAKETSLDLRVGAIVLSLGYELFDPRLKKELGYGRYPNVISALQFERILSPAGPFAGKVLRPSDKRTPTRIAFIQCVGSRDYERDYCSAVCCMYATKEAIIAKEQVGEHLECDIFFMDMRAFGKGFETYFDNAKNRGVRYIRCRIPAVEEIPESKNLVIKYINEQDRKLSKEYDLVVLSVGMQPPRNVNGIAEKFGIELNEFNFCKTSAFDPVGSAHDGIYVAGPFTEPKDIPETVLQGSAAAAKVLSLLRDVRGSLIIPKEYPPEIDVKGQEPRVGVFVCHCGTNIASVVNVPEVVEYAKTLPNVVYAENSLYTCSNDTQERIREKIKEHYLNRVVVASCTPRTHEVLFRNTIREVGLNSYLFEMANIRDQCSWVHMHEPEKATEKAKDLVRMAIAKVKLDESLHSRPLEINHDALVIGGGLAGMTAALGLADQGFGVYLVEKEPELGGYLRRVHYLLNGEDPQQKLRDLLSRVKSHKNIRAFTNATVAEIKGSLGNFESKVSAGGNGPVVEVKHGVVIVATGADSFQPKEYLFQQDDRVLLNQELEERIAANQLEGKSVAFIQCVGSRNPERPYCSRTCCSETIKHALKLKELRPETQVYVLYREMRTYGFREAYYTKARKLGVTFIRFADDKPPTVVGHNGKLSVIVHIEPLHETVQLLVDNVVLAAATVPLESNRELAQMLKVPLSEDRFFLEAHRKLRPVDFATDGIFLCGNAHSPLGIEETISQALGAAARAATILSKKQIDLEPTISHVVEENCDGCAYCVDPCPFKAITLVDYEVNGEIKKRVQVNESICKGCGTCMATCPKKAIYVWHFRPEQLSAEVKAALGVRG